MPTTDAPLDGFRDPPVEYRPVPFWSWNETMEPAEVARQTRLIGEAGWGGGFVHSRIGLLTPYLGDDWFTAAGAAVKAAKGAGLDVWLYDEDKWPSGFSGGSVPLADERFRQTALFARQTGEPTPDGAVPYGEAAGGLQVYRWRAPLGHDWFNGTCYAQLAGRDAMRRFLDDAYEPYFARFGDEYGRSIKVEFTDEPCAIFRANCPAGAVPFADELPDRYREMFGHDVEPGSPLLFQDGEGAEAFRLRYYRALNDLFERNFSQQIGDWCGGHGIALTGHYMSEHSLYEQHHWGVQILPNYRRMGVPGVDHLNRQIAERITAKGCSSVANQYGRRRVLSELYGCCGGGLSFEDRHWIAGQQMALGVNLLNPHLSLYTMAGVRKRDYPQNLFYQQPWWPRNATVDRPLARTCYALSQGRPVAEILVIHPQETVQALWRAETPGGERGGRLVGLHVESTPAELTDVIKRYDLDFKVVTDRLLAGRRLFDYGDEQILADDGTVDGNLARVGEMRYAAVVLPAMRTMRRTTLDLLRSFLDAGGTVVRCGEAARLLDGEPSEELATFLRRVPSVGPGGLAELLATALPPAVRVEADSELLWTNARDLDDGRRLVYLVNLDRFRTFDTAATVAGEWRSAERLDPITGESHAVAAERVDGGLRVPLRFEPTRQHLLVFSKEPATTPAIDLIPPPPSRTLALDDWTARRLDDNAMTLDVAYWREGDGDWSPRPLPVLAIQHRLNAIRYRGPVSLRFPVKVDDFSPDRPVKLVLERPEWFEITVNGTRVEYAGLPFWRDVRWMPIDVTGLLRPGENAVELHCRDFHFGDLTVYEPQWKRYGTELESLYLVGDFDVRGEATDEQPHNPMWDEWGLPPVAVRCFAGGGFRLAEPSASLAFGDTTTQGLPFYAGRLELETTLPADLPAGARFAIDDLDAPVADVAVDGEVVGSLATRPLTVALPAGGRRLTVTLYSTLRNLMGPHHHPRGELCLVGPGEFSGGEDAGESTPAEVADRVLSWSRGTWTPPRHVDRYCMTALGELANPRVEPPETCRNEARP